MINITNWKNKRYKKKSIANNCAIYKKVIEYVGQKKIQPT